MAETKHQHLVWELLQTNIEAPIKKLYKENFEIVVASICNNGGNRDDGADVFQEALVLLIEKVRTGQFRGESSLNTYLFAIAKNLWLHALRTKGRRSKREKEFVMNEPIAIEPDKGQRFNGADKDLSHVMEQIGSSCKKILNGFYYEKKSMRELLAEFDYENEQVLRNRKSKCMKSLKHLIVSNPALHANLKLWLSYE